MLTQAITIEQTGSVAVAHFHVNQLDAQRMQEAVDELMHKLRCDGANHVVLNLAEVEFLSSACLGTMVQFLQEVEHVRGRIALAGCRPNVAFLFKVTRLDSIFKPYDDVAEAVAGVLKG